MLGAAHDNYTDRSEEDWRRIRCHENNSITNGVNCTVAVKCVPNGMFGHFRNKAAETISVP